MSSRPCSELRDMFCGVGGLLVYEFGTGAALTAITGALGVGGVATAGTTTVAGVAVAGLTFAKAAGALLKLGKKSVELLFAALKYLKNLLPVKTFEDLLKYLKTNLSPGAVSEKIKVGLNQISESLTTTKRGTPRDLVPISNARTGISDSAAASRFGTSSAETLAIRQYASGRYLAMNELLRNSNANVRAGTRELIDNAVSGMEKLKSYPGRTYRGANIPEDQLRLIRNASQSGDTYIDPAFISTSTDPTIVSSFDYAIDRGRSVHITLDGQSGRNIEDFSSWGTEDEILFMPNTEFRVKSYEDAGGVVRIHLEEVPKPSTGGNLPRDVDGI